MMVKKRAISSAPRTKKASKQLLVRPSKGAASPTERARGKVRNHQSVRADHDRKDHKNSETKVIRDSFTMPVVDYELIGALKNKCIGVGVAVKKSELLRAGLQALARMTDESLAHAVAAVESVKTGRPPGGKKKKKAERAKGERQ